MKSTVTKCLAGLLLFFAFALPSISQTDMISMDLGDGISGEQAESIISELKQIRVLLGKIEKKGGMVAKKQTKSAITTVSSKSDQVFGSPNAPLTIVEFTDYQCPFCSRFSTKVIPELEKKYIDSGKLRIVVKSMPLAFHKYARKAAQAARCAGEQGQFLAMHKTLFKNSTKLDKNSLVSYGQKLSLDMDAFEGCLSSNKYIDLIDRDISDAKKAGIRSTPTFVIGKTGKNDVITGVKIIGAKPFSVFDKEIKKLLK